MSLQPPLLLGGVEIVLQAGAPDYSESMIGGDSVLRLSTGAAVKMTRYQRHAGSISGSGWIPPGLDGLDYSLPLELRSTQVSTVQGAGPLFNLPSTPRPDFAPWAFALVGPELMPTECSTVAGVATVTAGAGARAYQVWWLPVYSVFAQHPSKSQFNGSAAQGWSIAWEEA
jgi:hypothetical protein